MQIGAQLYTVHDFTKTLEGLDESLCKIAEIGYKNVQVSGTCEYEAEWLHDTLKKYGLNCVITHIPADKLTGEGNIGNIVEAHNIFECDYIGLGYFDFNEENTQEKYDEFVKTYMPVAKEICEKGKYFMYHNHAREFQKLEGLTILEKLSRDFDKSVMGFTLDTYWAQDGGADPARYIEMLSGRVPCIHLKDMSYGHKMAPVGEGNINFERVFSAAEKAGTKYMLVEQDDCNGEDPFDCLKRSYSYLTAQGFK